MHPVLAFQLDTTFGQITADIVLLLFVGLNAWAGWRFGLVRRAVAFASIYAAILAATYLGNAVASLTGATDRLTANVWAFVIIYLFVLGLFEIMGSLYHDRLQAMMVVTFDRVSGAIAGVLIGIFETGVLFLVALAMGAAPAPAVGNNITADYNAASQAVSTATLGEYVVNLRSGLDALFGPALPGNLTQHFEEGTVRQQS